MTGSKSVANSMGWDVSLSLETRLDSVLSEFLPHFAGNFVEIFGCDGGHLHSEAMYVLGKVPVNTSMTSLWLKTTA